MRLRPMVNVAQRGHHKPSAKYLVQQPPVLPFRDMQKQLIKTVVSKLSTPSHSETKISNETKKVVNNSLQLSTITKQTHSIPNSFTNKSLQKKTSSAPVSASPHENSQYDFTKTFFGKNKSIRRRKIKKYEKRILAIRIIRT